MLYALSLLLACGTDTPEGPTGPGKVPPPGPSAIPGPPSGALPNGAPGAPPLGGPPPGGGPAGTSPFEDLTSSWRDALAVPVGATPACAREDRDGDGFPAARGCPAGDPATLDCDDADPNVTPDTERWVPPGPFLMGSASDHAGRDEGPVHVVTLSGYCLDRHEATAQAVGAWLARTKRRATGADLANLSPDGAPTPGREQHPATGLSWQEAHDYCTARGLALPTEAQWEKAARGGCEGGTDPAACDPGDLRAYPWGGTAPACERANHQWSLRPGPGQLCVGDTVAVSGTAGGPGPYGHLHLSGNAWEWVADAYHPRVYGEGAPRTDPTGPAGPATHHGMRGGSWSTYSTNMRAANRFSDLIMGSAVGVRCARPTVPGTPDAVAPLPMVTLRGEVLRRDGALAGRALYVTAFDEADVDPGSGRLAPGRSPVAEVRLVPEGSGRMAFALPVPKGGTYRISAALDGGAPIATGPGFRSPSGSGGVGHATRNPVQANADVDGVEIVLVTGGPPQGGAPQGGAPQGGPPPRR